MEQKPGYDENQQLPSPWEWVIIVAFTAAIMGYGWLVYLLVQDGPRRWDFGQLPDTPAESIYSTERPEAPARRQIEALPEAIPLPTVRQQKNGGKR